MQKQFFFESIQTLCSSLQIDVALNRYLKHIKKTLPIDGMFINIHHAQYQHIQFLVHCNDTQSGTLDLRVPLSEEQNEILINKEWADITILNKISHEPVTEYITSQVVPEAKSLLMLKIYSQDTPLGMVVFYSKQHSAFKAHHGDFIEPHLHTIALLTAFELKGRNLLKINQDITKQNSSLKRALFNSHGVIGAESGLRPVMEKVKAIAKLSTTVLLHGETGCGKEVVANAIHEMSDLSDKPFIKVNCGAIPESLIDSELFGYEKGAFTGANATKKGLFEQANGGTIFLDEIGELPLAVQVRLLRVLQNSTIVRVGGSESIQLNIRIIAATHRNLKAMVHKGEFREDLWYRLAIFPIEIPALRQRTSDIPLLLQHFIELLSAKFNLTQLPSTTEKELAKLTHYSWPGNVRELFNIIERAMIQYPKGPLAFDLYDEELEAEPDHHGNVIVIDPSYAGNMLVPLDTMIAKYISHALKITGGKLYGAGGAAELLDINPNTLRSKMKKLNLC
ncbi:sigma 54-interacting transcriptional regulator [Shewanella intestini]|uniref:Sigma-54-dependent Fis family transcriptional regulator n=1 Tax=Shewanella intestini TaxID=2017544 RepID=A0ABS5I3I7_9GAMM|nr:MULTISPECIES: sigma-54 dependent transcriptional regulator [Shewanella]MBR9728593.1 sigma-54-dependent Fis family transcriptional regulator [Shewanella intestini]MRG37350.1 AAA domain-containing protein [Shewanella sp. XMDDZSB0408]